MFGKSIFFAWSSILALSTATAPEAPDGPDAGLRSVRSFPDQRPEVADRFGAALADLVESLATDDSKAAPGDAALRGSAELPSSASFVADRCEPDTTGICDATAPDSSFKQSRTCSERLEVFTLGDWRVIPETNNPVVIKVDAKNTQEMTELRWKCGKDKGELNVFGKNKFDKTVTRAWVRFTEDTVCWYW